MDNFNISVEGFPTIEKVLEKTNVPNFEKEKSEMNEKRQIKLSSEEYKALNVFRMKLLVFYEEHKQAIRGEYTAELQKLINQIRQMLKEYKDYIIEIRLKYIKTKANEDLGVNELPTIKALPKRRIHPGDGLRERVIAGDDLKRDVDRLPRKYQEKIQSEIEKLEELKQIDIQEAREKRNEQRDYFWSSLTKKQHSYEELKAELTNFDQYEETDIKTILRKYEGLIINTRRKYIELSKLPNVDLNSPQADSYDVDAVDEANQANQAKQVQGAQTLQVPKEKLIDTSNLYSQAIIQEKIKIKFNKLSNNMTKFFETYADKEIECKCRNEGYVRSGSSSVLTYSTGLLNSDSIIYNVAYSVDICFPYENMEIECKIKNITKIGIRAIISEHNNPIVMFISREHNPDKDFEQYKENQIIKVRVIGHRFELNDTYISVIGELM
jgi:hypothetical protein